MDGWIWCNINRNGGDFKAIPPDHGSCLQFIWEYLFILGNMLVDLKKVSDVRDCSWFILVYFRIG